MNDRPTRARSIAAVALAVALLGSCAVPVETARYDWIVRGGEVLDGTGAKGTRADVGAADGRIVAIGDLSRARASRVIDATGKIVAPGFIDLHSHADLILLADEATQERLLGAKIRQGVTTVVVGNCGLGTAPASAAAADVLAAVNGWMTPPRIVAGAGSVADYLDRLERGGTVVHVATLVPHGPVRISTMGMAPGAADADAVAEMREAVARALDDGAWGLSVGLIYPPGMYTPTDELVALAEVVAGRDRLFAAHVRGSSETLVPATLELVEIARRSGARVHHSHLEAVGRRFFGDIARVLAIEDDGRAEGLTLSHDTFPYDRAATMMAAVFPPWSLDGGVPALLDRLRDPRSRAAIRHDVETTVPEWPPWTARGWPHNLVEAVGWDGILVANVGPGGPDGWVGRSLAEIAGEQGRDPFDVVADLMVARDGRVGQWVAEISATPTEPDGLREILAHPAAALVSDAEDYGLGLPHPAHAGAFARALRWAREGLLPVEEMVRRMTSRPAQILGMGGRGVLRAGAPADLVVFDPATVTDRADWNDPVAPAEGIPWVAIGGRWVVEDGRYVGGLAGSVLRAGREGTR